MDTGEMSQTSPDNDTPSRPSTPIVDRIIIEWKPYYMPAHDPSITLEEFLKILPVSLTGQTWFCCKCGKVSAHDVSDITTK
jgi:hypothetical protein